MWTPRPCHGLQRAGTFLSGLAYQSQPNTHTQKNGDRLVCLGLWLTKTEELESERGSTRESKLLPPPDGAP